MVMKENRAARVETKFTDTEVRIVVANPRLSAVRSGLAAASANLSAESEKDAMDWIESVSIPDAGDEAR